MKGGGGCGGVGFRRAGVQEKRRGGGWRREDRKQDIFLRLQEPGEI